MKQLLFALLVMFCAKQLSAQEVVYNEYRLEIAGIGIGTIKAKKTTTNNITQYSLSSEGKVWLLFQISVLYYLNETWQNNSFQSSIVNSYINGKKYVSTIKKVNDVFMADCHSNDYDFVGKIVEPFFSSVIKLYFEEPKDGDLIITENFGVVSKIKKTGEHSYEAIINKNKNEYVYKNGILVEGEIENPIKNFVFKKIK